MSVYYIACVLCRTVLAVEEPALTNGEIGSVRCWACGANNLASSHYLRSAPSLPVWQVPPRTADHPRANRKQRRAIAARNRKGR